MPLFFKKPVARVAINLRPRAGSWGGANQWTTQITRFFEYNGWSVRFDLKRPVDAVILTHTGLSKQTTFGVEDVLAYRKVHGHVPCLHRINDNDIRKETTEMDSLLARSNEVADHTVFVSAWLRDHHGAQWFDCAKPHSVIVPGADSRFFHPIGDRVRKAGEPLRVVTHHWSNNWKKGFDVYKEIDDLISGPLRGKAELWVIGRWPSDLKWKTARTFAPASGESLANLLRQCDAYISASRFEPGAMHVAEGLQCGLPLLYHRDSGGTVDQGRLYGMQIGEDLELTLREFDRCLPDYKNALLKSPPSGTRMCAEYFNLVQQLIVHAS
jgi:glycosyltransferase involved in cell wall biosynthesis